MKEDVYKMLAEHSTDVISRHSPDGKYRYVSPSVKRILGYNQKELIGVNVFDLFHPDDMDIIQQSHQVKVEKGDAATAYYRIKTKDGGYKWVETISKIIKDTKTEEPIEIHAFTRDVTLRKKHEDALKTSLEEKELLLKEIHHRVKNNLTIVAGLLEMQRMHTDSAEFDRVAKQCELRINSIKLVHEKLYKSDLLSEIEFDSYIRELTQSIKEVYDSGNEVHIDIDCQKIMININKAIPVVLIMNELITNAFKHAFKEASDKKIQITVMQDAGKICISFRDNGIGLDPDIHLKDLQSMGFTIIRTLISQLNADLDIHSENGTEFNITFPA